MSARLTRYGPRWGCAPTSRSVGSAGGDCTERSTRPSPSTSQATSPLSQVATGVRSPIRTSTRFGRYAPAWTDSIAGTACNRRATVSCLSQKMLTPETAAAASTSLSDRSRVPLTTTDVILKSSEAAT